MSKIHISQAAKPNPTGLTPVPGHTNRPAVNTIGDFAQQQGLTNQGGQIVPIGRANDTAQRIAKLQEQIAKNKELLKKFKGTRHEKRVQEAIDNFERQLAQLSGESTAEAVTTVSKAKPKIDRTALNERITSGKNMAGEVKNNRPQFGGKTRKEGNHYVAQSAQETQEFAELNHSIEAREAQQIAQRRQGVAQSWADVPKMPEGNEAALEALRKEDAERIAAQRAQAHGFNASSNVEIVPNNASQSLGSTASTSGKRLYVEPDVKIIHRRWQEEGIHPASGIVPPTGTTVTPPTGTTVTPPTGTTVTPPTGTTVTPPTGTTVTPPTGTTVTPPTGTTVTTPTGTTVTPPTGTTVTPPTGTTVTPPAGTTVTPPTGTTVTPPTGTTVTPPTGTTVTPPTGTTVTPPTGTTVTPPTGTTVTPPTGTTVTPPTGTTVTPPTGTTVTPPTGTTVTPPTGTTVTPPTGTTVTPPTGTTVTPPTGTTVTPPTGTSATGFWGRLGSKLKNVGSKIGGFLKKHGGKLAIAAAIIAGAVIIYKLCTNKKEDDSVREPIKPFVTPKPPVDEDNTKVEEENEPSEIEPETPVEEPEETEKPDEVKPETPVEKPEETEKPDEVKPETPVEKPEETEKPDEVKPETPVEEPEETEKPDEVKPETPVEEPEETEKPDEVKPETPVEEPNKVDSDNEYTVIKGDCVWNIAKKHLIDVHKDEDGYTPTDAEILAHTKEIMKLNELHFEPDNYHVMIKPGQKLSLAA